MRRGRRVLFAYGKGTCGPFFCTLSGNAARPRAKAPASLLPRPHTTLDINGATLRFYLGDCLDVLRALEPGVRVGDRHVAAVQPRRPLPQLRRLAAAARYLEWTGAWIKAAARALDAARLALPERRRQAHRSLDGDGRGAGRAAAPDAPEHHPLDQVDRHRSGRGGRRAPALDRDLAVGHYKPINSARFVNDCHEFVFHFTPDGRTPLDRRAIGVRYQDESNIARWQTGGTNRRCRGNTWFIPYETIQSRDKDRPHPATFPPRLADYCLRLHGSRVCVW